MCATSKKSVTFFSSFGPIALPQEMLTILKTKVQSIFEALVLGLKLTSHVCSNCDSSSIKD